MVAPGHSVLVFDGDCGFCTSAAEWVSRDCRPGFESVAWQHLGTDGLKNLGLSIKEAQEAAWWVGETGRLFKGHRAIAESLRSCKGWRRTGGTLLSIPPVSWLSAAVYAVVVRYRHRLPGGTPACRLTPPERHAPPGSE
jgi:predicted DCC family thiol-disulfide oxidoreductase YuxK